MEYIDGINVYQVFNFDSMKIELHFISYYINIRRMELFQAYVPVHRQ